MSIHDVVEAPQATTDSQVIAELASGALETIATIHAEGLAELVEIAENPAPVQHPAPVEAEAQIEADVPAEAEAVAAVETEVVQPVEALRAVPLSTRGKHFSEAATTEFATQRAA
jgi:hypothetical protein